jgi:hypothetical protein
MATWNSAAISGTQGHSDIHIFVIWQLLVREMIDTL